MTLIVVVSSRPFFMGTRAVEHHVFIVMIGDQMPENLPDDTVYAPVA